MKKYFLVALALLGLTSCFGGEETVDETGLALKSFTGFTIKIPSNWSEVGEDELPLPKSGDIEVAYASSQERQGYINNLVILSGKNAIGENERDLMKNNENFLKGSLKTFTSLGDRTITFQDSVDGTLLSFRGKYNSDTPEVTYLQTARACDDEKSYFITLSLAEVLESYDKYEYILSTFECE